MSKTKYRVVQTAELKYEIQEYRASFYDPRDQEPYYEWIKINEYEGENSFMIAKSRVDELVKKLEFPKVVYEKESKQ